jgi:hypothetical protein
MLNVDPSGADLRSEFANIEAVTTEISMPPSSRSGVR